MGTPLEAGNFQLTIPSYPRALINGALGEPVQGIYETSSTQEYELGTKLTYPDGRVFRYAENGAVALAKAYMTSSEALYARAVDELQSTYGTSADVGDVEIDVDVTTGGSWSDDAYAGGYMVVNKATGIGDVYRVLATEINASDDTLLRVRLETPIRTALDATSELTFVKAPWKDVVVMPTTAEGTPAGIPLVAVAANYFCWLQTGGYAPCYVDTGDTVVKGEPAGFPADPAVAGACGPIGADTDAFWGIGVYVAQAGEVAILDLKLDS